MINSKFEVMKKLVTLLLAFFWSCSEMYVVPEDHYMIREGKHKSELVSGLLIDKVRTLKSDRLLFTARFDESAAYDLGNNDHYDINKLMGFADANSLHHENSARFGWRYAIEKSQVEIFSYVYRNAELYYEHIADVALHETVEYEISITANAYQFTVGTESLFVERDESAGRGVYYRLFPYFGGDQTAPHDIHIYIKEVF